MAKVKLRTMAMASPDQLEDEEWQRMRTLHRERNQLVMKACAIWCKEYGRGGVSPESLKEFAAFLGDPYGTHRNLIVNHENPQVLSRLEMITGDNGRTYLKIIEARKGPEDEGTEEVASVPC